jgi:hypothetical protein
MLTGVVTKIGGGREGERNRGREAEGGGRGGRERETQRERENENGTLVSEGYQSHHEMSSPHSHLI